MSPILDLQKRLHETGRIRIGSQVPTGKEGKTRPAKLDDFRFTSRDEKAIKALAAIYGGTVSPWGDGQFEVFTEAREIAALLPPEQMSFTQYMELWSGGGCVRRCDGQVMSTKDGKPCDCPCVCNADDPECKPHSRLSVILVDVPGNGLWRLDTQGWNAVRELAGSMEMARFVTGSTGKAMIPCRLRLEQREQKRPGEPTRKFAVPVLDLDIDMGMLSAPRAGLTPVPYAADAMVPPLREQLEAVGRTDQPSPRSNAAEPVRPTGLEPRPAVAPTEVIPPEAPRDPAATRRANMHRLYGLKGITDRAERLEHGSRVVGRKFTSSNDLSPAEADQLIAQLRVEVGATEAPRDEDAP